MAGVHDVAKASGVNASDISNVFETMFKMLRDGEDVRIIGFGSFKRKQSKARMMTTPLANDGKPFRVESAYRVSFQQSKECKRRVNMKKSKKTGRKKT
jgi:nucleoid DNA-binding protein